MKKQFVYIDSSEEQEKSGNLKPVYKKTQKKNLKMPVSPSHRHCIAHNPETHLLHSSSYDMLVKNLLGEKISSQMVQQLITNIEDVELYQNINKRNTNYEYFVKKMEIDQKYRAMQDEKAAKLKQQNQRKKNKLYHHQSQNETKKQELELKKFIVEKKEKQERVVHHLKRQIRKYGFERIYNAHKKIKQDLKQKQIKKQDEMMSKVNKQRNQLLELQEQFQAIKQAKRINKIEQRKTIKQLAEKVHNQKTGLEVKLTKKKTFQV